MLGSLKMEIKCHPSDRLVDGEVDGSLADGEDKSGNSDERGLQRGGLLWSGGQQRTHKRVWVQ